MSKYGDLNGNSDILAYEIGGDYIIIEFKDGKFYKYNYASAGIDCIENMKKLAVQGSGLNGYISTIVQKNYVDKW